MSTSAGSLNKSYPGATVARVALTSSAPSSPPVSVAEPYVIPAAAKSAL